MNDIPKLWEALFAINRVIPWDTPEMNSDNGKKLFQAHVCLAEVLESLGEKL